MRLWPPLISDGGSLTFIITAILWKRKKNYACHDPSPPSIAVRARRSLTKLKVMYDLFSYTGFRLAVGLANCSVDFCIDYTDILQNFHVVVALGTTSGSQPAVVPAHWSSCTASHASKFNEHYHAIPVMERAPVRFFPRRKADTTIHSSRSPRRALRKVGPSSGRAHLCRNPSDSPSKCHGFFFFSSDHNKWRAQNLTPRQPRRGIQARGTRCRKGDSEHDPWIAGLPGAGWWPACLPGPTLDERTLPVQARTGGSVQNAGVARTGFSKMEQSQLMAVPSILFFCYCSG